MQIYRNPSSGRYALAVPYEFGNTTLLVHPDFLFVHSDGDDIVMDVLDPHRHDATDAAPEWAALADHASDHPDRVLAVIRDASGDLRALDLTAAGVGDRVAKATNEELREALFAAEGTAF